MGRKDEALGFWKAVRDVFPETKERRCWWHKIGNVLAAEAFVAEFSAKWPKVAAKITDDLDIALAFPRAGRRHLRQRPPRRATLDQDQQRGNQQAA
jgi:hypothetical protein